MLALVKPQFEVGRGRVGKGGVVRDGGDRREALLGAGRGRAERSAQRCSATTHRGCRGRRATARRFIWLADPARGVGARDAGELEALAREVEP